MTDAEWENRRLCSDGNCIGVIGEDGRCRECGRPAEPESEEGMTYTDSPVDDVETGESGAGPESGYEDESLSDDDVEPEADSDWSDRQLCSDGNCIGVIGADGRCKECGKPFDGTLDDE